MNNAGENASVEVNDWPEPLVEDDMESLVGSDYDELVFNVRTVMRKPELRKWMKFPNSKVFREAVKEYAIKKLVDIWFKSNKKYRISIYYRNEYG